MRPIIEGRPAQQVEAVRAVEGPDHHEMREALDIGEAGLKFGHDLKHPFAVVFCDHTGRISRKSASHVTPARLFFVYAFVMLAFPMRKHDF